LLPVGSYQVKITAANFKTFTVPSLAVNVAETHQLKQELEIGSTTQQVTVNSTVVATETESSTVGNVVGNRAIVSIPLATRNFTQILSLSSGVTTNVNDASQVGRGSQNTTVNGTGDVNNNYQMDGISISNFMSGGTTDPFGGLYGTPPIPSPDALQEFKVQTSQYDAGYGKSGGANVNIVTKSGTDVIHGTLFEFNRNDIFNANGFFQNRADSPRGELKQNQYGGTVGGPIIRNKLFGFFSYQGTRQVDGVASQGFSNVSLPEQLTNDRSAPTLGAEFCPTNNPLGSPGYKYAHTFLYSASNPLDSVACDGSNINPVALNILNAKLPNGQFVIPTPQTVVGNVGLAAFTVPATFQEDQGLLNFDYVISPTETLSQKFFYDYGLQVNPFQVVGQPPGGAGQNLSGNFVTTTKLTSILSNNFVNSAYFSSYTTREVLTGAETLSAASVGMTPSVPYWPVMPEISITGLFSFQGSTSDTGANNQQEYQWGDQISWNHGRHTIRAGFDEIYNGLNERLFGRSRGTLTFQTWPDFLLGSSAAQNGTSQSNISGVSATIQAPGGTVGFLRANYIGMFVQDDFKVNPRLTLNLGLRWEYNGTPYDAGCKSDEITPSFAQMLAQPVPPAGGTYAGYTAGTCIGAPLPVGIVQRTSNLYTAGTAPLTNFAPRIGFAWQPFDSSGRLVVRGGFGMFYEASNASWFSNEPGANEPSAIPISATGSSNAASTLAVPFNPAPPIPPAFNLRTLTSHINAGEGIDPKLTPATMFSESLDVQYELARSLVMELGYVGNRVEHILVYSDPFNIPVLASPTSPVNCGFPSGCITANTASGANGPANRVPVLGLNPFGISVLTAAGDSEYSSLQASLRKTFSHGLQFQASYTWGRTFTDARGADWVGSASFNSNDPTNHAQLRGPADFDRVQRLVVNYVYDLPNFNGAKGFSGKLLSGWGVSGVTVAQSGTPLTLTDTRGGGAYQSTTSRAELSPSVTSKSQIYTPGSLESRLNGYFNPSAFTTVPVVPFNNGDTAATGFGDIPTGFATGPGQFNWDLAVTKKTLVGGINENAYLEFRSEFFNAFNHSQFSNPALNVAAGTFGLITSTAVGPRIIQFGLKYVF
jgi:outer membrane receptor protein involved in Fe transport